MKDKRMIVVWWHLDQDIRQPHIQSQSTSSDCIRLGCTKILRFVGLSGFSS